MALFQIITSRNGSFNLFRIEIFRLIIRKKSLILHFKNHPLNIIICIQQR